MIYSFERLGGAQLFGHVSDRFPILFRFFQTVFRVKLEFFRGQFRSAGVPLSTDTGRRKKKWGFVKYWCLWFGARKNVFLTLELACLRWVKSVVAGTTFAFQDLHIENRHCPQGDNASSMATNPPFLP